MGDRIAPRRITNVGEWINVIARSSDDVPPGTLNSIFTQAGWKKGLN